MVSEEAGTGQELLTLEEAADFLCVSKPTMYRLLDQHKLSGMKVGKQWRFRKEDLLVYMQRGPAAQALAKVPMAVLDAELAFLAEELQRAGSTTEACDDPALVDEAGKITQLVRRIVWLLCTLRGSDIHLNPVWEPEGASVLLILRVDGVLREIRRLPFLLHDALVLEWKRQAEMTIDDRQLPLLGRAQLLLDNKLRLAARGDRAHALWGKGVGTHHSHPCALAGDARYHRAPLTEWSRNKRSAALCRSDRLGENHHARRVHA